MSKTKPFSIEEAKSGAEVTTREGTPVRILCYDASGKFPIVALLKCGDCDIIERYKKNGSYGLKEEFKKDLVIKEKPWRVEHGAMYYFIGASGKIMTATELKSTTDDRLYEAGNYFATEEEAQIVLSEIKAVLAKHRK